MPRISRKQKRIGAVERQLINTLIKKVETYNIFWNMKGKKETSINGLLMNSLLQGRDMLNVSNKRIPVAEFVGEQFRPEFYLLNRTRPICAVECKRLIENSAKSVWKAGLSQAILYSTAYKAVVLVFYDFTKDSRYYKAFQKKNSPESRFAKKLELKNSIRLVVIKPVDH